MIILQGQNLTRYFATNVLFDGIDIHIQDNSRVALVGRNGTGKSTLLKILATIEQPDIGHITKTKDLSIGYLDQHSAVNSSNTIWEEMLLVFEDIIQLHHKVNAAAIALTNEAILANSIEYEKALQQYDALQHLLEEKDGYSYEAEIRSVLHGLKFTDMDYNRSISELSGGQKTRLAMAKLLLEKHHLLILDEPTNHLDIETLAWLENYLKNYKGALLIVSHDRYFLDKIAKEVYEISQHKIHYYKGNYTNYLQEKDKRLALAWKEYNKQQDEIAKLEDFVAKNIVRSSTTKRAQSRRKQLEKMTRIEKPKKDDKQAKFQFISEKESGNVVLQLDDVAIGYNQKILSQSINMDIRKQQAIALVGPNGIGKSTLLKTILNQLAPISGHVSIGANVSIGYYDQEQRHLANNKDVLHELWDDFPTTNEKDIRSILGSFLFSGQDVIKPVSALSGGEKARLLLAKLAMQKDNFLILDEPTNHLDLDSKDVLENALINFDGTILFISHDRYFINRIATSIIELSEQGSTLYIGDYDYYLEKKQATTNTITIDTTQNKSSKQIDYIANKDKQRQKRQLERQVEKLEKYMQELENNIFDVENKLTTSDIFTNHEKALSLHQQLEAKRLEYDTTMNEWETVASELERL